MTSPGGKRPVYDSAAPGGTVDTGGIDTEATELADTTELMPGMMIGEYRIVGPLGAGGMGRVYAAEHPVIAKKAAIKVLHPELSVNREAVDRFVQEARSVNQIGHPNIVDIFSFGALPDGRNYFVMEWLRGESLRDRAQREPLAIADTLAILETVTLPLAAAHDKGIVHRDLKPDNVFLVDINGHDHPQVKLLDFGIAKLMGSHGLQRTQTGNMLGTPAYISPEQARSEGVDHRTDIYALGAMAFELLTGQRVFPATNAADMIAHHLYHPPRSVRSLGFDVPPELDALIMRMLAKAADDRPTLAQVRDEMRATRLRLGAAGMATVATSTRGMPMPTPGPVPVTPITQTVATARSRWSIVLITLLLVGAGATLAIVIQGGSRAKQVAPAPVSPPVEMRVVPPSQPTPVETKPAETTPAETTPAETTPADTRRVGATPAETKPPETKKKSHPRPKPTTTGGSAAKPFDPDAPM